MYMDAAKERLREKQLDCATQREKGLQEAYSRLHTTDTDWSTITQTHKQVTHTHTHMYAKFWMMHLGNSSLPV